MSMPLAAARIGYSGYSPDFSAPADRRRFVAYAEQRGLRYEAAKLDRPYDVVIVNHNSDLPAWVHRKKLEGDRLKLIFELIDSYFVQTDIIWRYMKGIARRLTGTDSRLSPDFLRTLIGVCTMADGVICSTREQQETISQYNPNVVASFDYFGDDIGSPKTNYTRDNRLKLVWEGQSTTLPNVQTLREPLNKLKDYIELHIVTDPLHYRYLNRFGATPSMDLLDGIDCPKIMHPWKRDSFSKHITACDIAIIPILSANPLWYGKPENKLVLLWQLGMPVLTTSTESYERTMAAAGIGMTCCDLADWIEKIEVLSHARPNALREIGQRGRAFALDRYSAAQFRARFDTIFERIGFEIG